MARPTRSRRSPARVITPARAARLYRLVSSLSGGPRSRADLLSELDIGLRTFYRELSFLKRCGVGVRRIAGTYALRGDAAQVSGRLPFPDPQLSFAELAELARGSGAASGRLAALLASVQTWPAPGAARRAGAAHRSPN